MKQKPKVAFITSRFPFDGKEMFFYAEYKELTKTIDATIIPTASKMQDCWFPQLRDRVAPVSGPFAIATLRAAAAEFAIDPSGALRVLWDVVSRPRGASARIRNALVFPKALAVTRFVRQTGFDHVHAYWLSTPSTVAYVVSQLTGVKWSATGHRWDIVDTNIRSGNGPAPGFVRSAQFIRTISERGRQLVLRAFGSAERPEVRVIHLGVETPTIACGSGVSEENALRIACIATLTPVKGHATLLKALRELKELGTAVRCTLIGNGPLRPTIEHAIDKHGLGKMVEIVPQMPHSDLMKKIYGGDFDAVVLTSVDTGSHECEGIPVSLIEAMAAGLPVIATRSGSVPELVDSSSGILVDVDDAHGVAAAIAALARDRDLRRLLSVGARKKVDSSFCITTTVAEFSALLGATCAGPVANGKLMEVPLL
ncbi:MAG TPA: glycosyltransferase family 4 protein [Candidatus Baltobacteraceae bacterium]|jgi:glycosyltransferase involved in cell wall biosynthesis|nr:glycosyltransferase family 4 protein [Candidatus Baltobacteraceae bacterium]